MRTKLDALSVVDCPFRILIDSAESNPFSFYGIRGDAPRYDYFCVHTVRTNLGRHPLSYGDYSVEGYFGEVAIERKSRDDCWGTILGWPSGYEQDRDLPGRRERFEQELKNLNEIESAAVVVEATMRDCLKSIYQFGKKPAETNRKIFFRTIISYQQRFPRVQWMFCDSKRLAEVYAFRWMYRFWRNRQ